MAERIGWRQRLGARLLGVSPEKPSEEKQSLVTADTLPSWQEDRPHFSPWSTGRAIRDGYKISAILYACVEVMADAAASVPLAVYRKVGDEWEKNPEQPLQALLDQPNPFMSRATMLKMITQHLLLGGNAIWTKLRLRDAGAPAELWPISPDHIRPVPTRQDFISHYVWKAWGQEEVRIEVEDILHFMQVDPDNPYWGMGSLQALFKTVETDAAAQEFQRIGMANRGIVGGVLSFKMPLSLDQYKVARDQVDVGLGGAANARKLLVLGSDANYSAMSMTPEEMDFIESRKMSRTDVALGMRVPPPMVGIYDDATLANIETSRKIFWLDRMIPFLSGIEGVLNQALIGEFGDPKTTWIGFDKGEVEALQRDLQDKVEAFERLVASGVKAVAAARIVGLDLDEDDVQEATGFALPGFASGPGPAEKKSSDEAVANWPEERKYAYWKRLDDLRIVWEERVAREVARLFSEEAERVAEFGMEGVDPAPWQAALTAVYMAGIEAFFHESYGKVQKADGGPGETKQFARVTEPVRDWARGVVAQKVTKVTDATRSRLGQIITQVASEQGGVDDVSRAIRGQYDQWRGEGDSDIDVPRSYTIARTEMGTIANYGNRLGVEEAVRDYGMTATKTWMSSRDSRVRDSHQSLDGQTRDLEEPYSNGLMFPNDPDGPAGQVINCRCVEAYDTKMAEEPVAVPEPAPSPAPAPANPNGFQILVDGRLREEPQLISEMGGTRSIRDFLSVPKANGKKFAKDVDEAIRLIDSVHGVGNLDKSITVGKYTAEQLKGHGTSFGSYWHRGGRANFIRMNQETIKSEGGFLTTLVHEIGHFIDHQGWHGRNPRARAKGWATMSKGKHLEGWRKAVHGSQAYKTLAKAQKAGGVTTPSGSFRSIGNMDYFIEEKELFARSYAQFIAEETRDPRMLADLAQKSKVIPTQWEADDFAPIREEMRKLFTEGV